MRTVDYRGSRRPAGCSRPGAADVDGLQSAGGVIGKGALVEGGLATAYGPKIGSACIFRGCRALQVRDKGLKG